MTFQIINPSSLGDPKGWNNGMLAPKGGAVLFVAGQTARNQGEEIVAGNFVEQMSQALENVLTVVREAGGRPDDIGRMTIYVTELSEYRTNLKPLGNAWRRLMGKHYPAMVLVEVTGLVDQGAMVEIEATAVI